MARDGADELVALLKRHSGVVVHVDVQARIAQHTVDELIPLVTCAVCQDIMLDPHYLQGCDHVYCKGCIERALIGNNCPTCRIYCGDAAKSMV